MTVVTALRDALPMRAHGWFDTRRATVDAIVRAATLRVRLGAAAGKGPIVVGAVDYFDLNDAPYTVEERVSESGRTYEVVVYLPEAYTADYMGRSDETGRLVRWGVQLSDGRTVSRDGAFRIRFPDAWANVSAQAARYRAEKREEYLAEQFWKRLTPDEREAMIASVDLNAYADARGAEQGAKDVLRDLRESKSPLGWADVNWYERIWDVYALRYLGGVVGSDAWYSAPWDAFLRYKLARGGYPIPDDLTPEALPLTMPLAARRGRRLHPWIGDASEYWGNVPKGERAREYADIQARVLRRFGGPYDLDALFSMREQEADRFIFDRLDPAWNAERSKLDAAWIKGLRAVVAKIQRGPSRPWSAS
jgi:hypothetical protein